MKHFCISVICKQSKKTRSWWRWCQCFTKLVPHVAAHPCFYMFSLWHSFKQEERQFPQFVSLQQFTFCVCVCVCVCVCLPWWFGPERHWQTGCCLWGWRRSAWHSECGPRTPDYRPTFCPSPTAWSTCHLKTHKTRQWVCVADHTAPPSLPYTKWNTKFMCSVHANVLVLRRVRARLSYHCWWGCRAASGGQRCSGCSQRGPRTCELSPVCYNWTHGSACHPVEGQRHSLTYLPINTRAWSVSEGGEAAERLESMWHHRSTALTPCLDPWGTDSASKWAR